MTNRYLYFSTFLIIAIAMIIYFFSDLGQLKISYQNIEFVISREYLILLFTIVILLAFFASTRLVDRTFGTIRIVQVIGISLSVLLFVMALFLGIVIQHWQGFAVCLVGWSATLTWTFTNGVTVQNLKFQHTFNILLRMRENVVFLSHRDNLQRRYPQGRSISEDDVDDLVRERDKDYNNSLYESVRYQLNYYEFISYGIRKGDLDSAMMEQTVGDIMIRFREKVRPIYERQKIIDSNRFPDKRKSKIYEHYDWLLDECWGQRRAEFDFDQSVMRSFFKI